MSDISRKIIDTVKHHLDEYGDADVGIPLEGDLEAEIDAVLLDSVFPVREVAE
jgi:hypothetical protein